MSPCYCLAGCRELGDQSLDHVSVIQDTIRPSRWFVGSILQVAALQVQIGRQDGQRALRASVALEPWHRSMV